MSEPSTIVFTPIGYDRFLAEIETLAGQIEQGDWKPDFIVGIGRGGLVPATFLSHRTGIAMLSIDYSSNVYDFADAKLVLLAATTRTGKRYLFVDDINDSGKTIGYIRETLATNDAVSDSVRFAVLIDNKSSPQRVDFSVVAIDRTVDKDWYVFPWEAVAPQATLVMEASEDPDRLGLDAESSR